MLAVWDYEVTLSSLQRMNIVGNSEIRYCAPLPNAHDGVEPSRVFIAEKEVTDFFNTTKKSNRTRLIEAVSGTP